MAHNTADPYIQTTFIFEEKNAIFNDFYFRFQCTDQLWLMMSAHNSSATAGMADRGAA